MNLENKIGLAFVALLFLVGISANANKALRGFAAQDADSSQVDSTPGDSQVINEASIVDEVIWVVGDEPILKSEVEATRLQSEAEGIKYAGDPIVLSQSRLHRRSCSCTIWLSIVLRYRSRRL